MQRISFKRYLIILTPCILLIGIMIPIATFASSPAHLNSSLNFSVKKTVAVINTCSTQNPQTIAIIPANHEIDGTAIMTSGDATESHQEALVLVETNGTTDGPFGQIVLVNSGNNHFEFTSTANNTQLGACFTLIGKDDDGDVGGVPDHTASVTFRIGHKDKH